MGRTNNKRRSRARKRNETLRALFNRRPVLKYFAERGKSARGWDWNAKLPSWEWTRVQLDIASGLRSDWDMVDRDGPLSLSESFMFVMFEVEPDGAQSREIAVQFDDTATSLFYYRDWTPSGLPFSYGESYWSGFWFQRREDAEAFHAKYGGGASWLPGFDEFVQGENRKRNNAV